MVSMDKPQYRRAFLREVAILARSEGRRSSLRLFGACEDNNHAYIVMELMPHGDLSQFVRNADSPWHQMIMEERWALLQQMVQSVHELHTATPPVLHRDIKPQNFLVAHENGEWLVKACDLGLSDTLWTHVSTAETKPRVIGDHCLGTAP